ncbi:MAG: hypothetical protein IPN00_02150 [Hydrogenophilales bacterium]|nr:hypothetical protein [Hydrogenophilales bacterium]
MGLVQSLYGASKENQTFLHTRLGLGGDVHEPYKNVISRWINTKDPRKPQALRELALIEGAVSSNRIEGVSVDPARITNHMELLWPPRNQ